MTIVFSEPIDAASVNGETIQLRTNGQLVPGTVAFTDVTHLVAEFIPNAPLERNASYELTISQGIQDLDRLSLASAYTVQFNTGVSSAASRPMAKHIAGATTATASSAMVRRRRAAPRSGLLADERSDRSVPAQRTRAR